MKQYDNYSQGPTSKISDEYEISILHIARVLLNHKIFIISFVSVITAATIAYVLATPVSYKALTSISNDPTRTENCMGIGQYHELSLLPAFQTRLKERFEADNLLRRCRHSDPPIKVVLKSPRIIVSVIADEPGEAERILQAWISEYKSFISRELAGLLAKEHRGRLLSDKTALLGVEASLERLNKISAKESYAAQDSKTTPQNDNFPVMSYLRATTEMEYAELKALKQFNETLVSIFETKFEGKPLPEEDTVPGISCYANSLIDLYNTLIIEEPKVNSRRPKLLFLLSGTILSSLVLACIGAFVLEKAGQKRG